MHRYAADLEDMIGTVAGAGGVTVLAHPWASRHDHTALDAAGIAGLRDVGWPASRSTTRTTTAATRDALRALARDLGLVVTGSSDYHGLGKVGHDLGCNTTAPDQLDRLLDLAGRPRRRPGARPPRWWR